MTQTHATPDPAWRGTLSGIGLVLFLGVVTSGAGLLPIFIANWWTGNDRDAQALIERVYAFAPTVGLLLGFLAIGTLLRLNAGRPLRQHLVRCHQNERLWLAGAALNGVGIGIYMGWLHDFELFGWKVAPFSGVFVLIPALFFAFTIETSARRAFMRCLVTVAFLEAATQITWGIRSHGELRYWDDITGISVGCLIGAVVWICIQAIVRRTWQPVPRAVLDPDDVDDPDAVD